MGRSWADENDIKGFLYFNKQIKNKKMKKISQKIFKKLKKNSKTIQKQFKKKSKTNSKNIKKKPIAFI